LVFLESDWLSFLEFLGLGFVVSRTFFVFAASSQGCSSEATEGMSRSFRLVNPATARYWSKRSEAPLASGSIDSFLHRTSCQPIEQAGSFQVAGAATEEACCLRAVDFPVACLVAGPAFH